MVLDMCLYTEPSKMWRKNLSSEETLADFKNIFTEEYHYLSEFQHINTTQADFHGGNIAITMQDEISEALENLSMART